MDATELTGLSPEQLCERVQRLEIQLRSKNRTIEALMVRVEGAAASRRAGRADDGAQALERLIAEKTRELQEQDARLSDVLGDLRRAQAQLGQAQKLEAIGALAAGVAHEINTPTQYVSDNVAFLGRAFVGLAAIAGEARSLCATAPEAAKDVRDDERLTRLREAVALARLDFVLEHVPRAVEQSADGLRRIANIVGAMKELSHPALGRREAVDLQHVVETTVTVARGEWKHVAEVETDFDPDLPPVPALRDELIQVLLNMLINAAHAIADAPRSGSGEKGRIRVTTRREGRFAVIRVSDTGTGIAETVRERIFDPFFTTKPVGKGTGQGLAIAHNVIVEHHGGRIDVETKVGAGTTFVVHLPLESREAMP